MRQLSILLIFILPICIYAQDYIDIYNKGVEAQNSQQYATAIEQYKKCLELKPDFAKALTNIGVTHYNWALSHYNEADYDACMKQLDNAERYKAKDPNIPHLRGNCYHEQKAYNKAIDQYSAAIKMTEKPAPYYAARAWSYSGLNNHEARMKDMLMAAQSDPENASYQYHCGKFKQEVSQEAYKSAIDHYNAAIEIDPEYEDAYRERGAYYMTFGQFKNALPDLLRAKELGAEDVDSFIEAAKFELQSQQD